MADTSVLIDVLRTNPAAATWLRDQRDVPACSEVTRLEIIRGLRSDERERAELLFSAFEWMPVTELVSRRAGELGRRFRRSHQGISAADLIIGATAELMYTTVATHNVKHFPMFARLRPPY